MKKLLFIILLLSSTGTLCAQQLDWQERRKAANLVDDLIEDYIRTVALVELGKTDYSQKQEAAFKALFEANAMVQDEVNLLGMAEDGAEGSQFRSIDDYVNDLKEQYSKGMKIKISKLQVDYSKLNDRTVQIVMERNFRAEKENGDLFIKKSDIILDLKIDRDLRTAKITGMSILVPPELIAENDELKIKTGESRDLSYVFENDTYPKDQKPVIEITKVPELGKLKSLSYSALAKSGQTNFKYKFCIGGRCSNEATVAVTISGEDPGPSIVTILAKNDKISMKEGESRQLTDFILKNDKYPANKKLTIKITKQPGFGKLSESNTYSSPEKSEGQTTDFKYKLCAEETCSDEATVEVTIKGIPPGRGLYITPMIAFGANTTNAGDINWGYGGERLEVNDEGIAGSSGGSFGIGLEADYYFTDMIGLGIGLNYSRISGGFDINDFKATYESDYYRSGEEGKSYEQVVTIGTMKENYTLTNIGIPTLLKFKKGISEKVGVFVHAGVQYNLSSSSKSTSDNGIANYEERRFGPNFDYGGSTVDMSSNENDFITIDGPYYPLGTTDEEKIAHFEKLYDSGHNVGIGIPVGGEDNSSSLDPHLNLLGRVGITYAISDKMSILVGGKYTSGTLAASDDYRIIDKILGDDATTKYGEYSSLLNSGVKYGGIGINVGLSIKL